MFWRILESAIASALSRSMIDARFDLLFDRLRRSGVLSEAELQRLRSEVSERIESVERESRELRGAVDRTLQGLAERLMHLRTGGSWGGGAGDSAGTNGARSSGGGRDSAGAEGPRRDPPGTDDRRATDRDEGGP